MGVTIDVIDFMTSGDVTHTSTSTGSCSVVVFMGTAIGFDFVGSCCVFFFVVTGHQRIIR
jgi:hypothetical protein